MKKVLLGAFLLLAVFLIYLGTLDRKVYYLSLGDSFAQGVTPYGATDYGYGEYVRDYLKDKNLLEVYVPEFTMIGARTTDLIRDIQDNKKVEINGKQKTIKNALIKADLVTLSIGSNDILAKLETFQSFSTQEIYDHIDESLNDLDQLLYLIREYCKEDIMVIGYYNYWDSPELDTIMQYFNKRAQEITSQYQVSYIDIYDEFSNGKYLENPKDIHPSKQGYQMIGERVVREMEQTLLKK